MSQSSCMHISQIREVTLSVEGCEDCLNTGIPGAPSPLPNLRACGLLRFVKEQTRDEALSGDESSDY
jgi:hypothetical protein